MFNLATLLAISAVAPSIHALPSLIHRHHHRDVPAQFQEQERGYKVDENLLEPYGVYHERYELFHCEQRHGTAFWNSCCHPLLKDEPLDALPDKCFEDVPCDSTTTTSYTPKPTTSHTSHTFEYKSKPTETSHHTPANVETPPPTTSTPYTPPSPTTTTSSGGGGGGGGGGGDGGGNWHSGGQATYYKQGGNAGACGKVHGDDALIVALNVRYYGNTGVASKYCGQKIELVNTKTGKSITAIIADVCPTCDGTESQDLSIGAMKALDPNYLNDGVFPLRWRTDGL